MLVPAELDAPSSEGSSPPTFTTTLDQIIVGMLHSSIVYPLTIDELKASVVTLRELGSALHLRGPEFDASPAITASRQGYLDAMAVLLNSRPNLVVRHDDAGANNGKFTFNSTLLNDTVREHMIANHIDRKSVV